MLEWLKKIFGGKNAEDKKELESEMSENSEVMSGPMNQKQGMDESKETDNDAMQESNEEKNQ